VSGFARRIHLGPLTRRPPWLPFYKVDNLGSSGLRDQPILDPWGRLNAGGYALLRQQTITGRTRFFSVCLSRACLFWPLRQSEHLRGANDCRLGS
jgi:hypothetical protein